MDGVFGFQPGRSSGVVDNSVAGELVAIRKRLEVLEKEKAERWTSAYQPSGTQVYKKPVSTWKEWPGLSITVPATGQYNLYGGIRFTQQAAGIVGMYAGFAVNGAANQAFAYYAPITQFGSAWIVNMIPALNFAAGQKLTIITLIAQEVEVEFDLGILSIERVG